MSMFDADADLPGWVIGVAFLAGTISGAGVTDYGLTGAGYDLAGTAGWAAPARTRPPNGPRRPPHSTGVGRRPGAASSAAAYRVPASRNSPRSAIIFPSARARCSHAVVVPTPSSVATSSTLASFS